MADTDLHERARFLLEQHALGGSRVVDVGCGSGAFALRLADAGFSVTGLDLTPERDHPTDGAYQYVRLDLLSKPAREAFTARNDGAFDAVVALEVIEHVQNPWEMLDFCRRLLRPGGTLLLSTPNVTSFFSRFRFFTSGHFHQFDDTDFSYGHVNPMTALMVERVLEDTGFEVVGREPGPPVPVLVWDRQVRTLPRRLLHAASFLVSASLIPVMRGGNLDGWSLFFVARRKTGPEEAG